jgi:hypothetical protein
MTPDEIDQRLALHGVHYDLSEEQFFDGRRMLEVEEVNALLPELSDDEIVSFQDAKWDEAKRRLWNKNETLDPSPRPTRSKVPAR